MGLVSTFGRATARMTASATSFTYTGCNRPLPVGTGITPVLATLNRFSESSSLGP